MTAPKMTLADLAEKGPNVDVLRQMVQFMAQRLMGLHRLTHHCHIVETGNESIRFSRTMAEAKRRIKAREQGRKGTKPPEGIDPF